mmetsp:Transcript_41772/g.50077  ORF Transcript_41772/g.50077 Transcript_41772/m.50077 type:complete len:225 (+) Transcript_41772:82-756(+)|eukprot:CAMPEP_0194370688 /NCGR_PEP_ID=MMETSP0174-20130528/19021_1 /TAXON_ID=216777 /ORGANISM="Proboscia alata, Strain PI-D3" /LENGTH=224 /DNA_ID=CAMNT_0039148305 /DNA_START=66 /DNA_END=740 /DNA_ORIENTATION=-
MTTMLAQGTASSADISASDARSILSKCTGSPDTSVMDAINRGNVVCFFDVTIGDVKTNGSDLGRIKFELFVKDCPKTVENFRQFCTGEHTRNNQPIGYKNSTFHRIIKDFMIQGGDFQNHDGTGKTCIYGGSSTNSSFEDENLSSHKHDQPGMLSMANSGKDTNGCQFFITCKATPWLDGKHVVFGKVLDAPSMLTVRKCEAVPTSGSNNRPWMPVRLSQCGEM